MLNKILICNMLNIYLRCPLILAIIVVQIVFHMKFQSRNICMNASDCILSRSPLFKVIWSSHSKKEVIFSLSKLWSVDQKTFIHQMRQKQAQKHLHSQILWLCAFGFWNHNWKPSKINVAVVVIASTWLVLGDLPGCGNHPFLINLTKTQFWVYFVPIFLEPVFCRTS